MPHDAVHFFIESQLALPTAFWGRIARGEDPDAIQAIAAAGGHASAKRAAKPDPAIVELLQAERLVEAFEAESWSGAADDKGLMAMARSGWESSLVPPLPMKAGDIAAIRKGIADFGERWADAAEGEEIMLDWRDS